MIAQLVRRILWLIPALFFASLVAFLLFSKSPANVGPQLRFAAEQAEDRERAQFGELPTFFNTGVSDVRDLTSAALADVEADEPERRAQGRRELRRLGGAGFPTVFASFDDFSEPTKVAIGLALAPVAARMHLPRADDAEDPSRTVEFWSRHWEARSTEYREANVKNALARLRRYKTAARLSELAELDTFALPALLADLTPPTSEDELTTARAIVEVAARVTERDDRIGADADLESAKRCVLRWRRFWWLYERDFTTLDGKARAGSAFTQTRYGKWLEGEVLSATREKNPATDLARFAQWARHTAGFLTGGLLLGFLLNAVSLGRGRSREPWAPLLANPLATGVPSLVIGLLLLALSSVIPSLVLASLCVGCALLAAPGAAQVQNDESNPRLLQAAVLTARSLPRALTASFAVEFLLGLPGLGTALLVGVERRDAVLVTVLAVSWLFLASLTVALAQAAERGMLARRAGWLLLATVVTFAALSVGGTPHDPSVSALAAQTNPTFSLLPATARTIACTLISLLLGGGGGLLTAALVARRKRPREGLLSNVSRLFDAAPSILIVVLVRSYEGIDSDTAVVLSSSFILWALVTTAFGDRLRKLRRTDFGLASLALGVGEAGFVRLHGWPFLRGNLGYAALTGLGVVLSLEASLSWTGVAQEASWGALLASEAARSQPPLLACATALLLAAAYFAARRLEKRSSRPATQA